MPRAKTPKGSKKAKEGASKLKADAAQNRKAALEERDRREEEAEHRAEEARAERERNPHVFTFDHSKIRCDEDFARSLYEQGFGYEGWWKAARGDRLNDMLGGTEGFEPPMIVKILNYGQAQQDPDAFAVGAELLGFDGEGWYYEGCVVEEVTETGYKVLFTEHGPYCDRRGKREELPRERLRSRIDLERFRVNGFTKALLLKHSSIRSIATYENLI